jgi:hypothetical protein
MMPDEAVDGVEIQNHIICLKIHGRSWQRQSQTVRQDGVPVLR